jgi:hypothetical protein
MQETERGYVQQVANAKQKNEVETRNIPSLSFYQQALSRLGGSSMAQDQDGLACLPPQLPTIHHPASEGQQEYLPSGRPAPRGSVLRKST